MVQPVTLTEENSPAFAKAILVAGKAIEQGRFVW